VTPEAEAAARALERHLLADYWTEGLRDKLRILLPGRRSVDRIAALLVHARAAGVPIDEAVRAAENRIAQLEIDIDVPVEESPTRPTPLLRFPLSDTGRKDR
jgi:hypothetical protein